MHIKEKRAIEVLHHVYHAWGLDEVVSLQSEEYVESAYLPLAVVPLRGTLCLTQACIDNILPEDLEMER